MTQLQGKRLGKTELISYPDADRKKLFGALYCPAEYVSDQKYPTIFLLYEQIFDGTFNGTIGVLNANGHAVMQPSVNLEIGFPGEAWAKGVTAAANKLIDMDVADEERLGLQGTSYGGYATNLLITQTNRFKAAINISGEVNMVSFYSDSPGLRVSFTRFLLTRTAHRIQSSRSLCWLRKSKQPRGMLRFWGAVLRGVIPFFRARRQACFLHFDLDPAEFPVALRTPLCRFRGAFP